MPFHVCCSLFTHLCVRLISRGSPHYFNGNPLYRESVSSRILYIVCTSMQHFVALGDSSYFTHLEARKRLIRRRYSYFKEGYTLLPSCGGGFRHALCPTAACKRRECEEKLLSGDSYFSPKP